MARPRNKYKDYISYILLRMGVAVMHAFELEDVYLTARLIGNLMYRFDKRHRNRAIEHLRLSFPDWPQERLEQVAKASVRNLVYLGIEVLFTTRMITHARWRNHLVFKNMAGPARMMLERKTGLIMLTGHFGNWEVVGYGLATIGFPQVGVARKLDNPYANEYIMGIREKMGLKIVDKAGATDSVEEVLANKGIVGFIADQDAGRKGAFVDFFGRKASTYKIIGLLAMHYQVPVVIGYGRRLDEQYHFEIGVERTIMPHEWADKPDQLMWITQEYTAALERIVRRDPEQYLWVHRRWKHRPKGEEPTPDGIA